MMPRKGSKWAFKTIRKSARDSDRDKDRDRDVSMHGR